MQYYCRHLPAGLFGAQHICACHYMTIRCLVHSTQAEYHTMMASSSSTSDQVIQMTATGLQTRPLGYCTLDGRVVHCAQACPGLRGVMATQYPLSAAPSHPLPSWTTHTCVLCCPHTPPHPHLFPPDPLPPSHTCAHPPTLQHSCNLSQAPLPEPLHHCPGLARPLWSPLYMWCVLAHRLHEHSIPGWLCPTLQPRTADT
jgi:hypothetical protein